MQLHRHQQAFLERDTELIVIGNGSRNFMAGFREHTGYSGALYTDPSLDTYRALALKRTVTSSLNPKSLGRAVAAFGRGFRQKGIQGDPWQQGGVFVIAPGGHIRFSFRARYAGDLLDVSTLLRALDLQTQPEAA